MNMFKRSTYRPLVWRGLWALLLGSLGSVGHALPGPELQPPPASFSSPAGAAPQELATGQAADGRVVVAFISGDRLFVQRLTAAGALDGAATQILQGNGVALRALRLSVGSGGHYAVGVQIGLAQEARVFIRRFDAGGSPLRSRDESDDGILLVDFGEAPTCANAAVQATNSPAVAVDGIGNLAYVFTRTGYCSTGPQGALQPDRTELYYRYAPVAGRLSDPVLVFAQSPVTSAGFRVTDQIGSAVALQDNGDALLAWNGHVESHQPPRSFVRTASLAQLTGTATPIEAANSFDRSAPQLGAKTDGYVLSWRGDFNDPDTGSQRLRCYAQARARDGSAQFDVVTLASCTDRRALIVQASGAFDVITVPLPGQNQAWSGRRHDPEGIERGFYSNGTAPNRFLDLGPRAWAPTLAAGRYLAVYNVEQGDGNEALLEPVRYGGPNLPPDLQLSLSPTAIAVGGQSTLSWSSTGATRCTLQGSGEFSFTQSVQTSGSTTRTYSQPGSQTFTLTCENAAGASASESRTLMITAPAVIVQAVWSPTAVRIGEPATVSYSSQNAQSCQATLSGEFETGAAVSTSGSLQYSFTQPGEQIFTYTCTGPGGSDSATATLLVTVPRPVVTAIWTPPTIRVGESATVSYTSQDAVSCRATLDGEIQAGGPVETSGSLQYSFTQPGPQVFTYSCSGPGGTAASTVVLEVTADIPTVSASWSPASVSVGESSTLSYSSQHAQSCQATLTGEFETGAVVPTSGSLQYSFTQPGQQIFSITCTGAGGSSTDSATLTVSPGAPGPSVELLLPDGRAVRLRSSAGTVVNTRTVSNPINLPGGFRPITPFIGFDVTGLVAGSSVVVTLTLPAGLAPTAYLKCAPFCAVFAGAVISGNQVQLTLTDGGAGDADGIANGIIRDPGAPVVATEPSVQLDGTSGGALGVPLLVWLAALSGLRLRRRSAGDRWLLSRIAVIAAGLQWRSRTLFAPMTRSMPRLLALMLSLSFAAPTVTADGAGQSILVLDASGSMWGQINGKPKVDIAREAVAQMLAHWPQSESLGLIAYGHRRKGDCEDIELISKPALLDKAGFIRRVNGLQAKGMTPITASVRMAAEQLRFVEQKATVVLVSDGEETCKADPCALGKELENAGIDFTAHVVGFDLPEGPARQQLQCLASSTGGRYIEARNAAELNQALDQVVQAPTTPAPSIRAEDPWFNKGCTLFDQPDYRGKRFQLGGYSGLQNRNIPDGWGKRMQSVHCQPGCTVLVFTEPDFYGQSWGIDRSYPNKSKADGWDDWHVLGSTELTCSAASTAE